MTLTEDEIDDLIVGSASLASPMRELELTPENWAKEFGPDGTVETPLGKVKMGDNQQTKLRERGRADEFGMIKPTLENPDFIIEEPSEASDGNTERPSSYLFVKSFIDKDGKKKYFFK